MGIVDFTCYKLSLMRLLPHLTLVVALLQVVNAKVPVVQLNYELKADMRVVEMGPSSEEEILAEGGKLEPFEALGIDRGGNIGVGLAPGIRCIEEKPMGEDGLLYCKPDSDNAKKRRDKLAQSRIFLELYELPKKAGPLMLSLRLILSYQR